MPSLPSASEIKECAEKVGWKPIKVWKCLREKGYVISGVNQVRELLKSVAEVEEEDADYIVYTPPPTIDVGARNYPSYTPAEALYIAIYEESPENAHEIMYWLLEPILLGDASLRVRQGLFLPATKETWGACVDSLIAVIEAAGDRRALVCKVIPTVLKLLVSSLPPDEGTGVVRVPYPKKLKEVCALG